MVMQGQWQGEFMNSQGARAVSDYLPPVLPIDLPGKHQQKKPWHGHFPLKGDGAQDGRDQAGAGRVSWNRSIASNMLVAGRGAGFGLLTIRPQQFPRHV